MSRYQEEVPIDRIFMDNRFNCRGFFTESSVIELQRGIREIGLQQPIGVRKFTPEEVKLHDGLEYKLIMGYRRLTAYRILAGEDATNGIIPSPFDKIPAMVETEVLPESKERILNLAENIQREGLTFLQEVEAVQAIADCGLVRDAIAREIGRPPAWVQQRLTLNKLPPKVREEMEAGIIKQSDLGVLYTVMRKKGEKGVMQTLEKFRGKRTVDRNASVRISINQKRIRNGRDIQWLQFRMQDITEDNCNIAALCLGWAGGNIDDDTFEERLEEWCTENGYVYKTPEEDI